MSAATGMLRAALLAAVILFLMAPLVVIVLFSVSADPTFTLPIQDVSLTAYGDLFHDDAWRSAALNSLTVAVGGTTLALLAGFGAALAIVRHFRAGATYLRAVVLTPLIFPLVIVGMGVLRALQTVGHRPSLVVITITHALLLLPYCTILLENGLRHADEDLEMAAETLGATRLRAWTRVLLPSLAPFAVAAALISIYTSWEEVVVTSFLANRQSRTVPLLVLETVQNRVDPTIAAFGTVSVAVFLLMAAGVWWFFRLSAANWTHRTEA